MAEAVRKLEYLDIEKQENRIVIKRNVNNKPYLKRRRALLMAAYSLFFVFAIASSILTLSNYTKITALNVEIRNVDAKIVQVEKEQMNLVAEIERIKSEKDIVQEAKTKLGMVYPEKSQIVYFTLEDTDTIKSKGNFVANIFSTLTGSSK